MGVSRAVQVLQPKFWNRWHMDVNTKTSGTPARAGKLDGYTIHLLKADGTIATVGRKRRDGTVKLTVEVRDWKGERRIPVRLARNPRSPEFADTVGKMKADLLRQSREHRRDRLN